MKAHKHHVLSSLDSSQSSADKRKPSPVNVQYDTQLHYLHPFLQNNPRLIKAHAQKNHWKIYSYMESADRNDDAEARRSQKCFRVQQGTETQYSDPHAFHT